MPAESKTPTDWSEADLALIKQGVGDKTGKPAQAKAALLAAIEHREHLRSWGWVVFSGIIDLLLAYLIWQGWPSSADWAIGLLVGVNMLFFGLSLVMTALAARLMGSQ